MTTPIEDALRQLTTEAENEEPSAVVHPFPQLDPQVESPEVEAVIPEAVPEEPVLEEAESDEPQTEQSTEDPWEYRAAYGGSGSGDAVSALNELGADGWELAAIVPPHDPAGQTVLYMKRRRG